DALRRCRTARVPPEPIPLDPHGRHRRRVSASTARPTTLQGTVIHGDGRGRALGFPTATLRVAAADLPVDGIYAATATVRGRGETFLAVVSVGTNPTFPGVRGRRVEVHLLDADLDLYG